MNKLKQLINLLFTKKFLTKFAAYFLLIAVFYTFSWFLGIFLLTFIFAYLFISGADFMKLKIDNYININCKIPKRQRILKKVISLNFLIVLEYIIFVWLLIFIISDMVPKLINELSELPKNMPFLAEPIQWVTNKLEEIKNFNKEIGWSISQVFSNQDMAVIRDIFERVKSASVIFLQGLLSLILSFVFLLDRFRIKKYLLWIKKSSFSFLYKEYKIIFEKIVKSFGLIIKAQATIAFVNAILTTVWLFCIWLIHGWTFPYMLTLWLIVFIAWFIPVLWVFISSIPIFLIAYWTIWWYTILVEILLLISIVHVIEAYYLNPKIVSRYLDMPVSLTFVILIISEHLFWVAWLLIWVSLFYFIVWLLRDLDRAIKKKKKVMKKSKK
jgi:predicted PurR-regulated permease PerM